MSERNQTVVILIVALLCRSARRPDHGTENNRRGRSTVVTAEPTSGLGRYPEAVLACAATAFGPRISR